MRKPLPHELMIYQVKQCLMLSTFDRSDEGLRLPLVKTKQRKR